MNQLFSHILFIDVVLKKDDTKPMMSHPASRQLGIEEIAKSVKSWAIRPVSTEPAFYLWCTV